MLGLTFKPNTDDMRESPALDIVPGLIKAGAAIRAYDPKGMEEARRLIDGLETVATAEEAIEGTDAVVIITEWNEFRSLDPAAMAAAMVHPVVVDLRNLFSPEEMKEAGIRYVCVGRPQGLS